MISVKYLRNSNSKGEKYVSADNLDLKSVAVETTL